MSDEFVSLTMMIVSETAAERELVRRAALDASIPVEFRELDAGSGDADLRKILERETYDVVFIDSRIAKPARQALLDAARASPGRPLAVLIGAAAMKTREVLTDGLDVDGVLAKPIEPSELNGLIDCCVQARLTRRVLIVDDSSTVRAVVRKVLQASRYRLLLDEAPEGESAIARAKQHRFDVVFLDCNMPGIDGFATLGALRQINAKIKTVMITGTRDARIEDRARAEGATDFLYKPFFAKDIDAVLNRLFGLMRPRWN